MNEWEKEWCHGVRVLLVYSSEEEGFNWAVAGSGSVHGASASLNNDLKEDVAVLPMLSSQWEGVCKGIVMTQRSFSVEFPTEYLSPAGKSEEAGFRDAEYLTLPY